jgi:hypothetical protein
VAEADAADGIRNLFRANGINIQVVHTPVSF